MKPGACSRCGNQQLEANGRCPRCGGVFHPAEQLRRSLGPTGYARLLSQFDGAPRGLKCPRCEVEGLELAFNGWFIDVCEKCHGAFVDFGESVARVRGSRPTAPRSLWAKLRTALGKERLAFGKSAAPFPGYSLVEVLSVPNTHPEKLATHHRTRKGAPYLLEASGVVSLWSNRLEGVDAMYCYARWRVGPVPAKWANLRIDEGSMEELSGVTLPFQKSHVYRAPFQGTGKVLSLYLSDTLTSWSDNSGALTVRLYQQGR